MQLLGGPVNAKDIPQERLDKIVDLLCEDNRADAMLLYRQTATVELETAWAAIQDILVDLGENRANLPRRAVDDDAYLEAQYYARWCLTESSINISEVTLGKCTFKQLPQRYQELFSIGPNRIKKLKFFPEKDIVCMVLMAMPLLFMWSTVPFLGIFSNFPLVWAWNTWPRAFFILMVLIVCIPPPIMGVYTVRMLQVMTEFLRKKKTGAHIYGLVIDGQNVVGRQLSAFEQKKNCLFLPCNRITNFAIKGGSRVSTAKFFIQFINHQDQRQWLMLESGSSYSLKPYQLYQIFQRESVSQG